MDEIVRTPSQGQRRRMDVVLLWFFIISMAVVLSICVYVLIKFVLFPSPPTLPVEVTLIDSGIDGPVCPGAMIRITTHLEVQRPTTLDIVYSVMDETSTRNIPNTQIEFLPRPHPRAGGFNQFTDWQVPSLPPGNYTRVTSIQGHNLIYEPEYLIVPFTLLDENEEECFEQL